MKFRFYPFIKFFRVMLVTVALLPAMGFAISQTSSYLPDSLKGMGPDDVEKLNGSAEAFLNTNPGWSIKYAMQALALADDEDLLLQKARAQRIIADAYYYKTDYIKAIDWYQASAETEKQLHGEISAGYQNRLGDVGFCFMELAIYDKADEYYLRSLEIAKKRNDAEEIATNLNNLGQSNFAKGNFAKAISYFDETLQIDRERQIDEYISVDLNNIGKVYFTWGKYEKALEYYFESLNKAQNTGNENMQAIRYSNIGQVFLAMDDFENALQNFNLALELDQKLGNTGKIGIRYSHIGKLHIKQENFDVAFKFLQDALRIFNEQNMISSSVITLKTMGELMKQKKDYPEALNYFRQSLAMAEETGMKAEKLGNLKNISEVYLKLNDFQKAHDFLNRFTALKDTLFNEEQHRQLAEFEARYETEKKEHENHVLRNEAEMQRNETRIQRKQKTIFILSGSASLLLALSFMILFSMKRKTLIQNRKLHEKEKQLHALALEKKEKENQHLQDVLFAEEQINRLQTERLQQKNRELSTATAHILNKNEVLGNIRKLVAGWLHQPELAASKGMKNLIREIDSNTDLDEQWEQFKLHFDSVHKGFFERLLKEFPKLTPNELKLCAYLRMNLSTKEIAQMLNISIESVITKRYRLRKKLGLGKDENLVGFIGGF
jgi:tetratricopeptide (TPR) repeat protein